MTFEIEKNIDVTPIGRTRKYPRAEMTVGDSFFVPCENDELRRVLNSVRSSGHNFCACHRPDCTVAARTQLDGIRFWLIQK